MFKKIAIIVFSIIIIGFLVYYFLTLFPGPEKVTENFYNFWFSYSKNNSGVSPVADRAYRDRDDITESLKVELDEFITSFEGGLRYDPILCTHDKLQSIDFNKASTFDNYAEVIVIRNLWGYKGEIKVTLRLIDRKWKIDQITCFKHFEKL